MWNYFRDSFERIERKIKGLSLMPYGGYGSPGFYIDPMYMLFTIPAALLAMFAQWRVRSTYAHWSQVRNARGVTGTDVAQILLPKERLNNVRVEITPGQLSDHYDPASDVLRLSPEIAQQPTVASMAVAAHEIGHAAQDRDNYTWMKVRSGIVPLINIGSSLGYLIFFGGLFAGSGTLAWIGVIMLSAGMFFALVTLPVELNASSRGMQMLTEYGVISNEEERRAARDMLNAAALTYIAAAAQAVMTVLYYVFILLGSQRRRSDD
jgi:Zn-dependent membrane protease YugP